MPFLSILEKVKVHKTKTLCDGLVIFVKYRQKAVCRFMLAFFVKSSVAMLR